MSSFSPKMIKPNQIMKGNNVLSKGRVTHNVSKNAVGINRNNSQIPSSSSNESARNGDQVKSSSMFQLPSSSKFEMGYKLGWNYMEILEIMIAKIRVNPTHAMGWFSLKLKKAWSPEEERRIVWKSIPQISPIPEFCNKNPWEMLSERRMLEI